MIRHLALALLALACMPTADAAAQDLRCADLLAAHHALPAATAGEPAAGCIARHIGAFTANETAFDSAQPVHDPHALVGTWLGDDISLSISGAMTPGQEVLRITEGAEPGTFVVRQYWFKTLLPPEGSLPWSADGSFTNLVAEATLALDAEGRYSVPRFGPPIRYFPARLQYRRVNELFVLGQINHFEAGGTLRRADDTLVMLAGRLPNPSAPTLPRLVTFTRVADTAPETALALITIMDQSQSRYFDCLTHQLTVGGPVLEAVAPEGAAQLGSLTRAIIMANVALSETREALATASGQARADLTTQMRAQMADYVTLVRDPLFDRLRQAFEAQALGCPDPRNFQG